MRWMSVASAAGWAMGAAARAQVLHDNGPMVTIPPGACLPVGGMASEVQAQNSITGVAQGGAYRVADDFTIVDPGGWTIDAMTHVSYQTGATTPTINGVTVRIWSGRPGDAGSVVVWGDGTTNRLVAGTNALTSVYRYYNQTCGTTRRVQTGTAAIGVTLPPGTYWLDWAATGSLGSGPWAVPVTITGLRGKPGANARQWDGTAWRDIFEGTPDTTPPLIAQDLVFELRGSVVAVPTCYANCDMSTTTPALNVNDFVCFTNLFAAGDPRANCDGSTVPPVLNVNDFGCFTNRYAAGCSGP